MNLAKTIFGMLLGRRLPRTSGSVKVPGIAQPVTIRRDAHGIPYIEAANPNDAWYGLGFCQGQDRAFQLELLLRVCRGTLSALVGPEALPIDRLSRRIGFWRSARLQRQSVDPELVETAEAFARGVTAGATSGCPRPAHELVLLRCTPTPFTAVDVLAGMKFLSLGMSFWAAKLARLLVLQADGPEAVAALSPGYPRAHPVTRPVGTPAGEPLLQVTRLTEDMARLTSVVGPGPTGGASNNWALASSRTKTGRALLANDPHLAPVLPAPWYLAHLSAPGLHAAGAAYIGGPAIAVGHNEVAAWGVTAGLVDNVDLYIEEIGPDGRSAREHDGEHRPCQVLREVIHVKGRAPVIEEVLVTPRGPIVSPALEGASDHPMISMRATWMEPRPIRGFTQMHKVESFEGLHEAFSQWPLASFNIVYADTQDTIGWQLVGDVPLRRDACNTVPMPAWDANADWEPEPVPYDQLPCLENPETGFVATANNKPQLDDDGPFLGIDWASGFRIARIVERLERRDDWDLEGMRQLQLDQQSLPWRQIRTVVLEAPARSEETRLAQELLKEWDQVIAADSAAATVFELFMAEMSLRIARAKAPRSLRWAMGEGFNPLVLLSGFDFQRGSHLVSLLLEQPEGWLARPWPEEVADALAAAIRRVRQLRGDDPRQWAWGMVHPVKLRHPMGQRRPLDRIFNLGPFPWGGDLWTVAPSGVELADPTRNRFDIANLRMCLDVGNWDHNLFVLAGGQSGNPLSPHYDDQLELWARGEGITMAWSDRAIERATRQTLRLTPDPSPQISSFAW